MASELSETEIDRLRIVAFKSNAPADRQAYFDAVSKWFQDRHYRAMDATQDIAEERRRQIEGEGWTPEHDDAHSKGELAEAAACYARGSDRIGWQTADPEFPNRKVMTGRVMWPWDLLWWKPTDRRRDLVKAGALIVAEIERLDRLQLTATS